MVRLMRPTDGGLAPTRRGLLVAMAGASLAFGFPRELEAAMDPAMLSGATTNCPPDAMRN